MSEENNRISYEEIQQTVEVISPQNVIEMGTPLQPTELLPEYRAMVEEYPKSFLYYAGIIHI